MQLLLGRVPDEKQVAYRQGPHFLRDILGKQRMHTVWLFKITRHLCQQLFVRDADIDGKAERMADLVFDSGSRNDRSAEQQLRSGHIHKGFVNAILLYFIGILL